MIRMRKTIKNGRYGFEVSEATYKRKFFSASKKRTLEEAYQLACIYITELVKKHNKSMTYVSLCDITGAITTYFDVLKS